VQVLSELEAKSRQVVFEASALTNARQQLAALDAQRREAALAVEEMLGAKGAALDDMAKEERLRQIRAVEAAYQVRLNGAF
jgi:acyl-homoserine lactone acylase PvdQ